MARILDGMLVAAFPFGVFEALVAEYRTVPVRPGLRKLHRSRSDTFSDLSLLLMRCISSSLPLVGLTMWSMMVVRK